MLETPHVIVGAAIATKVANPALSLPLAFASHFLLDQVPHWNPHLMTETEKFGKPTKQSVKITTVDVIISLISGLYIASKTLPDVFHATSVLAACFASALPDIIEAPFFFLGVRTKFIRNWIYFQRKMQTNVSPLYGILIQVIIVAAAFYWIST